MQNSIRIVTPENIELTYELAGVGSRFAAAVIDHLLQIMLILLITLAGWLVSQGGGAFADIVAGNASGYINAVVGIGIFLVFFGYFALFELLWAGQTPGKRAIGIRVLRNGGYPVDVYSSAVRNLVRIIDLIPPPYGVGLISIFLNHEYRRLGDLAAGTLVVKERRSEHANRVPLSQAADYFRQRMVNIDRLTEDDYFAVRRFGERRADLDPHVQSHIAGLLAQPLIRKLEMDLPPQASAYYPDLLAAIEERYAAEKGILSGGLKADPSLRSG